MSDRTRLRRRRRLVAQALVLVLVLVLVLAATAAPAGTATASPEPQPRPAAHTETVTLLTGDKVQLRGSNPPVTVPGPGRAGTKFQVRKEGGDTYVLPYDVMHLLGAGRLDRRLFNVTKLAALGYGDQSRQHIPLIVAGADTKAMRRLGPVHELHSVGAVSLYEPKSQAAAFWRGVRGTAESALAGGVSKIWLDGKVKATLDQSVPQIGAPAAWQTGYTGSGTRVAVLDSGIGTAHADLTDAVVQAKDFTDSASGTEDQFGHGTHVASIITGSGAASGGKYKGVAPDTRLLNGKVLDDNGSGSDSQIIAGMEWAVAQGVDVVNMSLGSEFPTDGTGPLDQAVNRLTAESGALFVVAAGNEGPGSQTVSSPAAADAALAVGAVDKSDQLADFSSRGPRRGDGGIKPDITAPGVGIVAARAAHATIGTPVGSAYLQLSGTSMAAPHVAGAAAILAGEHPDWSAGELKAALMDSAAPNPALTIYQQGTGRVDVARATSQQVRADAGSIDFGEALWPHNDDKAVARTVTYHNDGNEPVSLSLSTDDIKGPQGAPAPAEMFTLPARTLTVAAHGQASVELTANPSVDGPVGGYKGALVATVGTTRVRTAVALYLESESYDVTVKAIDWDGNPGALFGFLIANIDQPVVVNRDYTSEPLVLRLPKGQYYYDTYQYRINSEEPFSTSTAYFIEPNFAVTGDTTVTLDARDAVPVVVRTDRPEANPASLNLSSWRDSPWAGKASIGFSQIGTKAFPYLDDLRVRPSRISAPGAYTFGMDSLLARVDGKGGWAGSPYQYHLRWSQDGSVPATLDRRFRDRDLAELRTRVAAQVPNEVVQKDQVAAITTPGTLIERYSPGFEFDPAGLVRWSDSGDQTLLSVFALRPRLFTKAGSAGTERWNVGPFMAAPSPDRSSQRTGDQLSVELWMYSGQNLDHVGDATSDSARTRLLRDGVEVASADSAGDLATDVPAGTATYRLEVATTRSSSPFSSSQSAAWTFRSGTTAAETPLPLMMIRFAPELDDLNQAPAGRQVAVPVNVQLQDGAPHGQLTSVTVDVSYDDGATWKPAKMRGQAALLNHPDQAGFVSLRATATDSAGNKAEQTVIHAYRLRR